MVLRSMCSEDTKIRVIFAKGQIGGNKKGGGKTPPPFKKFRMTLVRW